jgi:hypothetical protein
MFFVRPGENCNVIQIDDYKFIVFSNEADVHSLLEGFSCIHQSKGKFGIHEYDPQSCEGFLLSVFRLERDLIVARKAINHEDPRCTCHPLQYVLHLWQGVIILLIAFVQVLEINTKFDFSILLSYWDQVGYPFKISQRDNDLGVQQLLYFPFHNRQQHWVCLS